MSIEGRPHEDIGQMMSAVEILSADRYTIAGQVRDFSGGMPQQPGQPLPAAPVFLEYLERDLYAQLYVRPSRTHGAQASGAPTDPLAQREFTAALSAANNGTGTWESGWTIDSVDEDGRVAVTRDRVTFWAQPNWVRTRSGQISPGEYCRVWVMKELRMLVPGFYYAIGNGNGSSSRDTTDPIVRIYWHLTRETAVQYMALVTGAFNGAGVPFRTKVISDPSAYVRSDAGVLYLERKYFADSRGLIADIARVIAPGLRAPVPMFTRRLADGIGVAEDPGNGLSFGQSRSNVIARALWECFVAGITDPGERLAHACRMLGAAGIDPERPHLAAGSTDTYDLSVPKTAPKAAPARWPSHPGAANPGAAARARFRNRRNR